MRFQKIHILGVILAVVTAVVNVIFLRGEDIFYFILGISSVIAALPFLITLISDSESQKEKETMFLEFSRNLVESVKAGTPVSRSIINLKGKDFGTLTANVTKLANQISLGIPVKQALNTFADDVGNKTVSRAVTLISEADQAGGEIETILDSVAQSVSQTDKLKKERIAAISTLVVQGYIIFLVFIAIMLIMEFKIVPLTESLTSGTGGLGDLGFGGIGAGGSASEITSIFLYLLIIQGFFAGLTIGKLSEGSLKAGIKHSFILVALAILISTGAKAFF